MTDGCLSNEYLYEPQRVWNRTDTICQNFFQTVNENGTIFFPYYNKTVDVSKVSELTRMLYKGNVLQYPSTNLGKLTKKMNFARIAKGFGIYRKKAWATQSDSYTSSNTNSLNRVEYSFTSNNLNGEIQLPECTEPIVEDAIFPGIASPSSENQIFPPPTIPPTNSPTNPTSGSSYNYPITQIDPPLNDSFVEGGTLQHCTKGNICTGEITETPKNIICFPTTASDVPGPIINLCYPTNFPVFIPRVRRTYTENSTKWPTNAKPLP